MQKYVPTLDKGAFPLKQIRDSARRSLLDLLDSVRGRKALVLEPDFASPLGLIAEALSLKEHGVEMFCLLDLIPSVVDALMDRGVRHVVYLLHCRLEVLQAAVAHIKMCQASGRPLEYTLLLAPRRTSVAERLLEEAGLAGDVTLRDYPLEWVPLDEDLLSLEMPLAFRELVVEQDSSCLYYVARALQSLQGLAGTIPHVKGKGEAACAVQRVAARMRHELGQDAPAAAGASGIDTLILLDRTVDLATPMATQLTYEGLLDEVFGLSCGQVRMESEGPGRKVYGLNSADAVFKETRDRFYIGARKWLNETLRSFQQFRDQGIHSADIPTLRGFVADLKEKFTRIPLHTSLVEQLATAFQQPAFLARQRIEGGLLDEGDEIPAIEELMYEGEPLEVVLRLLCLYCAVHGGVPKKYFDPLRRDLLNTYGHHHLLTLAALGKAGMLQRREGRKGSFGPAKQAFHLLLQEGETMSEDSPADIHFAYAGYAPLSVRIVQQALTAGWSAAEAVLAQIPGPQFEVLQTTDETGAPVEKRDTGKPPGDKRRTVMVVFIGGVTYAEVSALRFLSHKGLVNADFLIATTKMVTGSTLLGPLIAKSGQQAAGGAGD